MVRIKSKCFWPVKICAVGTCLIPTPSVRVPSALINPIKHELNSLHCSADRANNNTKIQRERLLEAVASLEA